MTSSHHWLRALLLVAINVGAAPAQRASAPPRQTDTTATFEIYGFVQSDAIHDFKQNNPEWFDVNRPSELPAFRDEFGRNGRTWFSVRQTRFGVKTSTPTRRGTLETTFEYDLFGVGPEAGQTTLRLQLAYGQLGAFGAGQLWSPFMDIDVFPNCLDYWGPNGLIFFRNVQVFWQPVKRDDGTRLTIALEQPGASGDAGEYADRIEVQDIKARFPAPDVSAEYRFGRPWGYLELAAIVRWIRWDDVLADSFDLSGGATGWGVALSSNVNASRRDVLRLLAVYGAGVENYFNDAPVDIAAKHTPGNPRRPAEGVALPDVGLVAFLDHTWTARLTSAIGYSRVDIGNSDAQLASAFRNGQYALANLLYSPARGIMMGAELQWGRRQNFRDGFRADDYRLQLSFRFDYAQRFAVVRDRSRPTAASLSVGGPW